MPMICSASWTICGASSDDATLRLFILSAQPIGEQLLHAASGCVMISSNSAASAVHVVAQRLQRRPTSLGEAGRLGRHRARLLARLGAHEGGRRARPRRSRCRATRADHRMCEYGTIVCADDVGERARQDLLLGPEDVSLKPGLHVPRMPSVSQVVVCVERAVRPCARARAPDRSAARRRRGAQVTSRSSACSPYETVVASLSSVKRPLVALDSAQMLRAHVAPDADLRGDRAR